MKMPPVNKRSLLLVASMVLMVPEWWAVIAGQGAKTSGQSWPFLFILVFQAVLLGLYGVLTVRTKASKWLVAIFLLIGAGGGVWWFVRTDPAEKEAIRAISLAHSACTSTDSEFLRSKQYAEAAIENVSDEFRKEELSNQLHNALIGCK